MSPDAVLPSWRAGATRDAIVSFLDRAEALPVAERVAAFDNDGTLWCEKPTYAQFDFFVDALTKAAESDPSLADRPEFAAVLDLDLAAIGEMGLERVGLALVGLLAGIEPADFEQRVRTFMRAAQHRTLGRPLLETVYQPMIELIQELRRRQFTIFIVTGGGTEFVRAISDEVYGIAPEAVVGTLIAYEFARRDDGRPVLYRTNRPQGRADEGPEKVANIQSQLGRRPILGVGNSAGDREMLEFACASENPGLALLVNHDDATREFSYASVGGTVGQTEPIVDVAHRLGWTVISMADDWLRVFPEAGSAR